MNKVVSEISVAPMMELTDRHCRYFLRLISPHSRLYTEMITANALIYGDKDRFLKYSQQEHPIAIQLGGSNPKDLAHCAELAQQYGYDEINLNVGCPSDRVQNAKIGACLMAEPELVAQCVASMQAAVSKYANPAEISVKTRIGIDNFDSYEFLYDFIDKVSKAGCTKFIIHARKAWLQGLSPKQNRDVPKLDYSRAFKIKQDFNNLKIILNGGIDSLEDVSNILNNKDYTNQLDGIMIGRAAYSNPLLLAQIEQALFNPEHTISRLDIIKQLMPYIYSELIQGTPWTAMARHYMGLFKGQPRARLWRQFLSERRDINANNFEDSIDSIIEVVG